MHAVLLGDRDCLYLVLVQFCSQRWRPIRVGRDIGRSHRVLLSLCVPLAVLARDLLRLNSYLLHGELLLVCRHDFLEFWILVLQSRQLLLDDLEFWWSCQILAIGFRPGWRSLLGRHFAQLQPEGAVIKLWPAGDHARLVRELLATLHDSRLICEARSDCIRQEELLPDVVVA